MQWDSLPERSGCPRCGGRSFAAGIGGGSADAAAMARLVRRHFLPELGDATLARLVSPLGADIAACIASTTCLGVGVGDELSPVP